MTEEDDMDTLGLVKGRDVPCSTVSAGKTCKPLKKFFVKNFLDRFRAVNVTCFTNL